MSEDKRPVPAHVGIIMDGNGRWAKAHGVPRVMGHNAGMQAMKKIVIASSDMGIKYLTVYAFSTESSKSWTKTTCISIYSVSTTCCPEHPSMPSIKW